MDDAITLTQNHSFFNHYKENYVVPWSKVGPIDEISVVVLSICITLLLIVWFLLLYARFEVKGEQEVEHAQRLTVIYINTVGSFIALLIILVSMDPVADTQKSKGWVTTCFLLLCMFSSVIWLIMEPLSIALAKKCVEKKRSGSFYVGIGWATSIIVTSAIIGLHFALKEPLLDPYLMWFHTDSSLAVPIALILTVLVVHLLTLLLTRRCKPQGKNKLKTTEKLGLRCVTINTTLMVPTTYASFGVYGAMLHDYHMFYEYILVTLLSLQSLWMFLRYIIFNPVVKDSIVDIGRKEYLYDKVDTPPVIRKPAFVA